MTGELSSWRDGPAKQAIIDFVARRGEGGSPAFRRRNGLRSSTTTAPCGVRSRCRSSWISSFAASPKWPGQQPELARAALESRVRARPKLVRRPDG